MSREREAASRSWFRRLLRLFPAEFRADFGGEMEEVFARQREEAERAGRPGVLRLWWETLAGIFATAPREHWEMLRQDAGYAVRMMRKNLSFTVAAALTLALGIGANTAIFSVVYGVLLKPLPYSDGHQLVQLAQEGRGRLIPNLGFSEKELADYRGQTQTLTGLVEYHTMNFILLGGEEPRRVVTGVVSPQFFRLFGVRPLLGRDFRAEDDQHGAEAVLLLTHRFWERAFGGDRNIVGRVFRMNDRPHTVIGVLPPLPLYPDDNDVWMPVSSCPFRSSANTRQNRNTRMVQVFGRIAPQADMARVQSDLATVSARLVSAYPENYPKSLDMVGSATLLEEEMTAPARLTFLVLLATAGFVLLIACSNVANLTLARLLRRERELGVRAALGASRARLMRQMLTESTLLALAGGALGLGLAAASVDLLAGFAARFTPRANEVRLDTGVLLFTLGVSVLTGLLFGAWPAVASARRMFAALHESGRSTAGAGRSRARSVLLAAQVAFSFVLLIGAGLMARSFVQLMQVHPGFNPERVLSARLTLNFTNFNTPEKTRAFWKTLLEKLEGQPGIVSAGALSTIPLGGQGRFNTRFRIEGREVQDPAQLPVLDQRVASSGYFATVGIPLLRGRLFTAFDHAESERVVLINQTMARRYWGEVDPVGKRIGVGVNAPWATIVGIVGDVRTYGLDREIGEEAFIPLAQGPFAQTIFLRTTGDPRRATQLLRIAVRESDATVPVDRIRTLGEVRMESVANPRLTAVLMGLFAGVALLITVAGIAGVMALSVSQRTREIGIRLALGATHGAVTRMVLRQGLAVVLAGLAVGTAGALALTGSMRRLLYAVEPTDPGTYVAVAMTLVGCAAAACWLPARRAAGVDPLTALRTE